MSIRLVVELFTAGEPRETIFDETVATGIVPNVGHMVEIKGAHYLVVKVLWVLGVPNGSGWDAEVLVTVQKWRDTR